MGAGGNSPEMTLLIIKGSIIISTICMKISPGKPMREIVSLLPLRRRKGEPGFEGANHESEHNAQDDALDGEHEKEIFLHRRAPRTSTRRAKELHKATILSCPRPRSHRHANVPLSAVREEGRGEREKSFMRSEKLAALAQSLGPVGVRLGRPVQSLRGATETFPLAVRQELLETLEWMASFQSGRRRIVAHL